MPVLALPIAIATFVLIFVIVLAPYWTLVVRVEGEVRQSLRKRLKAGLATARAAKFGVLREQDRLSNIGLLERMLARGQFVVAPIQRTIAQAGLNINVGTVLLASGCAALLVFVVVSRLSGLTWAGLILAPIAALTPYWVLRFLRSKRLDRFEEQFPEGVDLVARTLRAGHAFTTGLKLAAEELPDPVAAEFQILHDRQKYGLPLPQAMREFAERVPILDARFFVTAVLTQREAGGNLAEVLDNLSAVIRGRFQVKRQVRVITAHGRATGVILSLLPPVLAFALSVRAPENFRLLINDPFGVRMIIFAVVLQIVGTLLIRRISNVEY